MKQVVVAVLSLLLCAMAQAGEWTVGVLAMRSEANTRQQWQTLELMLNHAIPEERFHIQPLDLRQMREAVNQRTVSGAVKLANSASCVTLRAAVPKLTLVVVAIEQAMAVTRREV
ncbi:MAG: hypothetical protein ACMZI0_13665 [Symbiopectobacterium sp.]|uniref:hypothetical protein n=1 Tax=Symbiopectobacterium sp. TaxID=2952789 RepID=UPI0039EBFBF7